MKPTKHTLSSPSLIACAVGLAFASLAAPVDPQVEGSLVVAATSSKIAKTHGNAVRDYPSEHMEA